MHIKDIFTSFLAFENLSIDNQILIDFCKKQMPKDNSGSGFLDLTTPELQPLLGMVGQKVNELYIELGLSSKYRQIIHRCWANINYPQGIQIAHTHPESFFSCVYYVNESEDAGFLTFFNPVREQLPIVRPPMIADHNKYWAETMMVPPRAGMLVIFPSWLWHSVNKGTNDRARISFAIDTKILSI